MKMIYLRGEESKSGRCSNSTMEKGKHVILFGERGVGKTSLAKVFYSLFPSTLRHMFPVREQADPSDTFASIWQKVFKDIHVKSVKHGRTELTPVSDFYAGTITPDDIRRELKSIFRVSDIPMIIIDEYDKIGDRKNANEMMANTIKLLSDYGVNVTIILVGVADNVNDLIGEHPSLGRCVEQIPMPRMNIFERREILNKIVPRLGMHIVEDAALKIIHLSRGLPAYVHSLGLYSTDSAIQRRSLEITEADVDKAMKRVLERSRENPSKTNMRRPFTLIVLIVYTEKYCSLVL